MCYICEGVYVLNMVYVVIYICDVTLLVRSPSYMYLQLGTCNESKIDYLYETTKTISIYLSKDKS